MTKLVLSVASLLVFVQTVGRVDAAVYNLHLITDNQPDYTDIESFVASITGKWKTPREKSIAIWRWGRRSRRQTSGATDDGRLVRDPILHYNSYGTMNCGVISGFTMGIGRWAPLFGGLLERP